MNAVVVSGGFDDIRSCHVRFLQEAARFGPLHVMLWSDAMVRSLTGNEPKFPQQERLYYIQAIRYVDAVHLIDAPANIDELPAVVGVQPEIYVVHEREHTAGKQAYCQASSISYEVLEQSRLAGFPDYTAPGHHNKPGRKKVLVTGCYDWFHSGHVKFFEEVSELGDLYVVVGHDANVRSLKGQGHPMFGQEERRYMVQSVRYVKQALISTGHGWLDAEPQIKQIRPDIYAVNEEGDQPIKRQYCQENGLEYVVLRRIPRQGLHSRDSTTLRGF